MKKILSVLLVVTMLLCAAACSEGKGDTKKEQQTPPEAADIIDGKWQAELNGADLYNSGLKQGTDGDEQMLEALELDKISVYVDLEFEGDTLHYSMHFQQFDSIKQKLRQAVKDYLLGVSANSATDESTVTAQTDALMTTAIDPVFEAMQTLNTATDDKYSVDGNELIFQDEPFGTVKVVSKDEIEITLATDPASAFSAMGFDTTWKFTRK